MSDDLKPSDVSDDPWRRKIITNALTWIDTPYQHQASLKGEGSDCLGLIRGVWRELYGREPAALPPYTVDWAERNSQETLYEAAREYLTLVPNKQVQPGDVLMFRMQRGAMCKHVAIMTGHNTILHAYWGRAVVESYFAPYWKRRWAYSFSFPKLENI